MLKTLALAGMVASLVVPSAQADDLAPPSGKVTVSVQTINGSGCPAGSASVDTNSDNTSFYVEYDKYVARDGGGAQPTEMRRNCQLSLLVNVPQGFTYAIARADYRGDLHLARGATAQQNAYYYFMGETPTAEVSTNFTGARSGHWQTTSVVEAAALVYAPCGQKLALNVNTDLRVNAGDAEKHKNSISMNDSKGSLRTLFHFSWKRCH
ncbi:MAG TPA: DUF4360 domain-containing protein [Pilimelia sp.]|nr:DUF4360 domain-containing protein [Pilimelia sp.]